MLEQVFNYMKRRKQERTAQRLAALLSKGRKGTLGGTQFAGDVGPPAKGFVTVQLRPANPARNKPTCDCDARNVACAHWENVHFDPNLVVSQAELLMAQMAIGSANSDLNYIELGDPSAPANPAQLSDINLQQSTGERKVVSKVAAGNVVTLEATWTSAEGNGFTYTEAGLFTGLLGSGSMFARKTFAGITKTAAFEMRFTWLVTFLVNTQGGDCAGVGLIGPSTIAAFTVYDAGTDTGGAGGEASVAATFDFVVGGNHIDAYLNGQRLVPGVHYNEANAPLNAPIGGPAANKGINLNAFTLSVAPTVDQVFLIQRTLA